jgi:hypothetical protein
VVKATFEGLKQLRTAEEVAKMRGKSVADIMKKAPKAVAVPVVEAVSE